MCTLRRSDASWQAFHSTVGVSAHLGSQNQHPKKATGRLHEDRGQRRGLSWRKGLELYLHECLEQSGAGGRVRVRGPFPMLESYYPKFRFSGEKLWGASSDPFCVQMLVQKGL